MRGATMNQLKLDFTPRHLSGKKTQRLTITCSDEFKSVVDLICRLTNQSVSELGQRYFIDGIKNDLGAVFMAEPHLDKKLSQLITKNF